MRNRYNSISSSLSQIRNLAISRKTSQSHLPISVNPITEVNLLIPMTTPPPIKDQPFSFSKSNPMEIFNSTMKRLTLLHLITTNQYLLSLSSVSTELVKVSSSINFSTFKKMASKLINPPEPALKASGCGQIPSKTIYSKTTCFLSVTVGLMLDTEGLASL